MNDRLNPWAKNLRTDMTDAEHMLWRQLRAHRFAGWKIRRQQPIGNYIVDFACMQAKLVIEADGGQHNGSETDAERDAWLRGEGYTVLRYWNNQILQELPQVLEDIERALSRGTLSPTPIPSRERGLRESPATDRPAGPRNAEAVQGFAAAANKGGWPVSTGASGPPGMLRPVHHEDDTTADPAISPSRERRNAELRLYGLNAVHAVYARRPGAIRKVYLSESRIPALQPLLKWCVANRVGYRVVDEDDLHKLAASTHHEGVVADVLRAEPGPLSEWLRALPAGPQCAIWLDGVGNPHNLGAILRSAAHFGVAAVLLPKHSPLTLSGAAARVAEGGAEAVPLVRLGRSDNAIAQLRSVGFALAATLVDGGSDLFATAVPERVVYVLGAESQGMDRELAAMCDLRLSIPGSGAVESLNVAAATAVLLAAWRGRR